MNNEALLTKHNRTTTC